MSVEGLRNVSVPPDDGIEMEAVEPLPVRMLNESVYCARLFYLMHVMGEWASSADTERGRTAHRGVDRRQDSFPAVDARDPADPRTRARSIMLASEGLGIIAKMDVVEVAGNEAVPVDYKRGRPPQIPDRAWPPERIQVCAQGLILEEHGWLCDHGVLYFPASRERVDVVFDDELRVATVQAIANAREIEKGGVPPPPLVDSPKCPRCSLVGICLPDETMLLRRGGEDAAVAGSNGVVRRLMPSGDDVLPLHLATPGARVSVRSRRLVVKDPEGDTSVFRFKDLSQVNLFGGVQITTQAVQRLLAAGVTIGYFSGGGWFYGLTAPIGHSAVQLRRRQFARSVDDRWSLGFSRELVRNKIRNSRTLLRRNHKSRPAETLEKLRALAGRVESVSDVGELRGVEGLAAREYFSEMDGMFRDGTEPVNRLHFEGRNRRPPRDPVNALLSLAYSLLVRHFTAACVLTGLDPHVGFFHADRPGRPSLALDLMEPFRPLIADSAVITAVNNGEITSEDFIFVADSCALDAAGRKKFIASFERRLDVEIRHPVFGYRISYRRVIEVQTRLFARYVLGELERYTPFETR